MEWLGSPDREKATEQAGTCHDVAVVAVRHVYMLDRIQGPAAFASLQ